jgi:hypothetical protein
MGTKPDPACSSNPWFLFKPVFGHFIVIKINFYFRNYRKDAVKDGKTAYYGKMTVINP